MLFHHGSAKNGGEGGNRTRVDGRMRPTGKPASTSRFGKWSWRPDGSCVASPSPRFQKGKWRWRDLHPPHIACKATPPLWTCTPMGNPGFKARHMASDGTHNSHIPRQPRPSLEPWIHHWHAAQVLPPVGRDLESRLHADARRASMNV